MIVVLTQAARKMRDMKRLNVHLAENAVGFLDVHRNVSKVQDMNEEMKESVDTMYESLQNHKTRLKRLESLLTGINFSIAARDSQHSAFFDTLDGV
jgi:hypothetical protein